MIDDLEFIPTNELIEKAERTPLEKAIVRSGCFVASAFTVGSWFAVFWYVADGIMPKLILCLLASIIVPFTLFSTSKFIAEFRNRHVLRELDRRFGRWNIPDYIRYYQQRNEPRAIRCVFRGQALPHGRRYWGCVLIDEAGQTSLEAAASSGLYLGIGADPWCGTECSDREFAEGEREEIRELIEKTRGTGKSLFSTGVRDGFPAWVAVIYGDGDDATVVLSNLSGLTDEQRQDDRIKLLSMVATVVCNDRRFGADEA